MSTEGRWYFTKEQLKNSPSRKHGYTSDRELFCRQDAASFIFDAGVKLHLNYGCINTATMYMHRFYTFHSFAVFQRHGLAAAALFLAAKVAEQPRKLEYVIKVVRFLLYKDRTPIDKESGKYKEEVHDLLLNENVLLQTLGFELTIALPHTSIVRIWCTIKENREIVHSDREVFEAAYSIAHCCMHLTVMCLQYSPNVIACLCIFLACKWSNYEIPKSANEQDWFKKLDANMKIEQLEELSSEFMCVLKKCPEERKTKVLSLNKTLMSKSNIFGLKPQESDSNQEFVNKMLKPLSNFKEFKTDTKIPSLEPSSQPKTNCQSSSLEKDKKINCLDNLKETHNETHVERKKYIHSTPSFNNFTFKMPVKIQAAQTLLKTEHERNYSTSALLISKKTEYNVTNQSYPKHSSSKNNTCDSQTLKLNDNIEMKQPDTSYDTGNIMLADDIEICNEEHVETSEDLLEEQIVVDSNSPVPIYKTHLTCSSTDHKKKYKKSSKRHEKRDSIKITIPKEKIKVLNFDEEATKCDRTGSLKVKINKRLLNVCDSDSQSAYVKRFK